MGEFIKISNNFLWSVEEEPVDGYTYINRQTIVSIEVSGSHSDESICTIKTIDNQKFLFKYEENHPEWIALFSGLNK